MAEIDKLIQQLKSQDWRKHQKDREALEKIGDSEAVESLIQVLKDSNWIVRSSACGALGNIGDKQAIEPLIQTLKDRNEYVRWRARGALGKIGKPAVEPLIKVLKDSNWIVRSSACEVLGEIRDNQAIEPLIQTLKNSNQYVRENACEALGKIGDLKAVEPLIQALKDNDKNVRISVYEALIQIQKKNGHNIREFFCNSCLRGFEFKKIRTFELPFSYQIAGYKYMACRECHKTEYAFSAKNLIAILDSETPDRLILNNGTARANWLIHKKGFDFDSVEIIKATDFDVEQFCIQVGNDTEKDRRKLYKKMNCKIHSQSNLSENTLRVLRETFGKIEMV